MDGEGGKSRKAVGHSFSFCERVIRAGSSHAAASREIGGRDGYVFEAEQDCPNEGQSRSPRVPSRRPGVSRVVLKKQCFRRPVGSTIVSQLRQESPRLFLAARSDAAVSPPPTLLRSSDSRMPCVGSGARLELSVRELTPIHEISDDNRPYSIFGPRFITTFSPAASAFAAAASSRAPSCIQITFGSGVSFSASSTIGMMWLELRKISTMSMGWSI